MAEEELVVWAEKVVAYLEQVHNFLLPISGEMAGATIPLLAEWDRLVDRGPMVTDVGYDGDDMTTTTELERGLTWRQLRLLDWMRDPQHPSLPQHEAIRWSEATWKASRLALLSGVTEPYTYAMCRHDLRALQARGLVHELAPDCWMVVQRPSGVFP